MKRRSLQRGVNPKSSRSSKQPRAGEPSQVRVIGGHHGGRLLKYSGDARVRPMKDRTREALFSRLGASVGGTYAWDLFAGTGVLGLEAMSRGAIGATLVERHLPTAKCVAENIATLGLENQVRLVTADVFRWLPTGTLPASMGTHQPWNAETPWLVFCCPPYAFYQERFDDLREALTTLRERSPAGSIFVVEAEMPFDFESLWPGEWDPRRYAPALLGIWKNP